MDRTLEQRMLREMLRVRRIDERMLALQRQGEISFYGAATGQEAVAVGVGLAVGERDWVFPALRESAVMLVRGFDLSAYLAQCFGNRMDELKGRQMPSHMASRTVLQASWGTCVGTQLPHAVGVAWAMRLAGDGAVSIGLLGDGATSHPDFHAAMNFASVRQAPCVLICQNNGWAISTPVARQTGATRLVDKAQAYAMRSMQLDGNDVREVHRHVTEAIAHARAGRGPSFLECLTYRIGPHSSSDDPDRYRSVDEVTEWTRRDPIERLVGFLRAERLIDDSSLEAMIEQLDQEIEQALRQVRLAPAIDPDTLFDDVYASMPWHLQEQRLVRSKVGRS